MRHSSEEKKLHNGNNSRTIMLIRFRFTVVTCFIRTSEYWIQHKNHTWKNLSSWTCAIATEGIKLKKISIFSINENCVF